MDTPPKKAAASPYLPHHSDWFSRNAPGSTHKATRVPLVNPLVAAAEKSIKRIIDHDKAESLRNNSRIISRKLKDFERVLEKSYGKENFHKNQLPLPPCDQAVPNPSALSRKCPRPRDRSCIFDIHSTLPDYDSTFNPLKNPEPFSNIEQVELESWGTKKSARRIMRAYNPLIVPLPVVPREATSSLQNFSRKSPGYVPLSPARYLAHRLPRPRMPQRETKARPNVSTRRRIRTPPFERPKSKQGLSSQAKTMAASSATVTVPVAHSSSKATIGASDSTKYPRTGTSPSEGTLSGCKTPPSTTAPSSENLAILRRRMELDDSKEAVHYAGGGDIQEEPCRSEDSEFNEKPTRKFRKSKRSICNSEGGSIAGSEKSRTISEVSKTDTKTTSSSPLKGILKKASESSSHVSISLLTKIGVCTAQPGTKEWDKYWEKYDKAIAQFKRTEALFLKDSRIYREDLEKFRKEAARMAMEDAIFRQSIGLEPRQVHEVMGQPLMGLTTLNGFVFDRNYGPHRPQAFLTTVGSKGVRLELDLRGYDPDDIKVENEFNLIKVHIPPDDPKDPIKTIVIGMASDFSVSDMEVYPIVNGRLVIEAPDKKHFSVLTTDM